jgi:hypothetical protein
MQQVLEPLSRRLANGHDGPVAFLPKLLGRRLGPVGVGFIVYDVWRHLPAKQREQLLAHGVKHGSRAGRYIIHEGSKQIRKRLG